MTSKASFSIRIIFYFATQQRDTSTDITKASWKSDMFSQYLFNSSSLPQGENSWKEKEASMRSRKQQEQTQISQYPIYIYLPPLTVKVMTQAEKKYIVKA